MIEQSTTKHVNRSAEHTFGVIGTGIHEYHPQWEREVVENRPVTPDPIGLGSRGIMVRREFGRTTETEYVVTEFEQDRTIAFHHPGPPLDFDIRFEVTSIDDDSCTVRVDVAAQPEGWTRILQPVMRLIMPRQTDRLADSMVAVIEAAPARTP